MHIPARARWSHHAPAGPATTCVPPFSFASSPCNLTPHLTPCACSCCSCYPTTPCLCVHFLMTVHLPACPASPVPVCATPHPLQPCPTCLSWTCFSTSSATLCPSRGMSSACGAAQHRCVWDRMDDKERMWREHAGCCWRVRVMKQRCASPVLYIALQLCSCPVRGPGREPATGNAQLHCAGLVDSCCTMRVLRPGCARCCR